MVKKIETELFKEIKICRSCNSDSLTKILSLGNLTISNFINDKNDNCQIAAPLELMLCSTEKGGCGLVQLQHTVDSDILYRQYWYRSGVNQTMLKELSEISESACEYTTLEEGDCVIDIGANDGSLLRSYPQETIKKIGFEPAVNLSKYNEAGTSLIIQDYFSHGAWQKEFGEGKAKIITAIGMFYDLDEPNTFVSDVARCLADDGVFIIQMMYLPSMIERNAFDGICHEHLEYYSLSSLEILLDRHGLEICDVLLKEEVNEGSIRVYVQHKTTGINKITGRVTYMRQAEDKLRLGNIQFYEDFRNRIESTKDKVMKFIHQECAKGKVIHGYAASTKGNTTLQFYGVTSEVIDAISDRNPDKWGKFTASGKIQVISENESRQQNPDYYFVLAWHFLPEFLQREIEFLKRGGKFIVPMPEFKVIDFESSKAMMT